VWGVGPYMFIIHRFVVRWYQAGSFIHNGISWNVTKQDGFKRQVSNADTETSALLLWGQNGCTMRVISSFGIPKWNSLGGAINIMRNQFYGRTEHMIDKVSEFVKLFLSSGCISSEVYVTLFQSAYMFFTTYFTTASNYVMSFMSTMRYKEFS